MGAALQTTFQTQEGYCLGVWEALWDAGEHGIYYGMFVGGTIGSKREGARWFGEEEAWENWGARGLKSAGCMYIVCWLVCLSGYALHLISTACSTLFNPILFPVLRTLQWMCMWKYECLQLEYDHEGKAAAELPFPLSGCMTQLDLFSSNCNSDPTTAQWIPADFEGRIYTENLKTSMQEQNVGTQLTSNKTDRLLGIPSVWAIAEL